MLLTAAPEEVMQLIFCQWKNSFCACVSRSLPYTDLCDCFEFCENSNNFASSTATPAVFSDSDSDYNIFNFDSKYTHALYVSILEQVWKF